MFSSRSHHPPKSNHFGLLRAKQENWNRQSVRTTSHLLAPNLPRGWQSDRVLATNILDLPIRITKFIFSCVPLEDLLACMLTCSAWFNVLSDENIPLWKEQCMRRLDDNVLTADYLKMCPTYKSKLRALLHSWNPHDCSPNGNVEDFIFVRNQVPQSTDGCRGKISFREGRHVWQMVLLDPLGSVAAVGVATHSTVLTHEGYGPLIGNDRFSWGWNLVGNILVHKGSSNSYYPNDPKIRYKPGDILHVLLDCDERTLSFKRNGQFLGVAFRDLPTPKKELFPAVSVVYGGSRVSLVYLGTVPRNPKRATQ